MTDNDKIKWHPGFANALKLEFYDNKNDLEYSEEVVLNKEALKMDMLVIKKKSGIILKNQLGEHFRQYNIIEFKSTNDDLNIEMDCFHTSAIMTEQSTTIKTELTILSGRFHFQ